MAAGFVDQLSAEDLNELEVEVNGQCMCSPTYQPRALLTVRTFPRRWPKMIEARDWR